MSVMIRTREEWLDNAVIELRDLFKHKANASIPVVKVSVGFPAGSRITANGKLGQFWPAGTTDDLTPQIFISPQVDDPVEAMGILVHELCHACAPDDGHRGEFRRIAHAVGLTGPMQSTTAGPTLKLDLRSIAERLGEFPHSKVNLAGRKKQETRLIKAWCQDCGYTVRVTQKWLSKATPVCPNKTCALFTRKMKADEVLVVKTQPVRFDPVPVKPMLDPYQAAMTMTPAQIAQYKALMHPAYLGVGDPVDPMAVSQHPKAEPAPAKPDPIAEPGEETQYQKIQRLLAQGKPITGVA